MTDMEIWNRLFKFPQMDFEMAVWEMTSLLIAPKKVFKSIYYHVSGIGFPGLGDVLTNILEYRNVSFAFGYSSPYTPHRSCQST